MRRLNSIADSGTRQLNSIAHSGIKGMKWYIRRFQNKDGSLTPEGRKRYGVGESQINSSDDLHKSMDKDYYSPDTNSGIKLSSKEKEACADLGLNTLREMYPRLLSKDDKNENLREWFLYEDQTIGLPTVAHLINKGHSAKEIKNFIHKVNDEYSRTEDRKKSHQMYEKYFDILQGEGLDEFADACEKTKKKFTDNNIRR